jgi:hypothetical protein
MAKLVGSIALGLVLTGQAAAATIEEKIEILQQEIEQLKSDLGKRKTDGASPGAATTEPGRVSIGGYGEAVYNNFSDDTVKDLADLKRFVLYFGYRFNERTRFFSELEVEHAFASKNTQAQGEVEMESAYIEHSLGGVANFRAGLMLMPIGLINETHEPPTYFGVERNEVESRIIPTTWRELGVALQGTTEAGLEFNAGIATTPDISLYGGASKAFRDMRVGASKQPANDFGWFAALNYRGVPNWLIGGSVFNGNTGQDGKGVNANPALRGVGAKLSLAEVHARYQAGELELRGLFAAGGIDDGARVNAALGITPGSGNAVPEAFSGAYLEAGYHVWRSGDYDLAPFLRVESYDTQERVASGFTRNALNDERVTTIGLNFKLHPNVVLKADVQRYDRDAKKDRFNLGVGYMF